MALKTVAYWGTLMRLAHEAGQAKLSGDAERIAKATAAHDEYRDLCLASDEMLLGETVGSLGTGQSSLTYRQRRV